MDLEERSIDTAEERCQECGARLTTREIELALENGGPSLCGVHAAETTPLADDEPADAGL